jgi:hypothetical protein
MSDFTIFSGDLKRVRITVYNDEGDPVDLDLATEIEFQISEWAGGEIILEKLKSLGEVTTFQPDGETMNNGLMALISAGDLVGRGGEYYYIARITMPEGILDTVRDGTFTLKDVPQAAA